MASSDASLSEYERILRIDPGAVKARFGYAAALIRLNRYREARDRLVEAMDLYPNELAFARAAARLFAAAPDDRVRDGRRAMAIVQALVEPAAADHRAGRNDGDGVGRGGAVQRRGAVAA